MSKLYEICQVPAYDVNYDKSKKMSQPINVLSNTLLQDLQLHERLAIDDLLKLSMDIDKMTLHNPSATFELELTRKIEITDINLFSMLPF
jgi:hypothetical protein